MSWEKFGSPYDPNHRGKMKLPPEKQAQAGQKICKCGGAGCSICNTASIEVSIVRPPSGWHADVFPTTFERFMREGIYTREAEARGSSPPSSYMAARRAVERWLVEAPDQKFDDIVGNDAALEQLRDAIEAPVRHKAVYDAYGMRMPKGALLSGPPGCGKTMFARAAASEMRRLYGGKVEFVSISGSELQSPFVGMTEGYIKAIFTFAREYRKFHGHPLLVFMDEAEVLLPDRTGRVRRVAPWEESQVATFLAEMDGIVESGAFILLASNRPEVIDQAVLRDGRCDFKIIVQRPTPEAIEVILRKNFAGILVADGSMEQLVFAAVEGLLDPAKILMEGHAIKIDLAEQTAKDVLRKHFLLEHIVSGAMAASIPMRATRHAFARDKLTGEAKGVTVADVLQAVNDLFEENKGLEHSFALNDFKAELMREAREAAKLG
ncbi:MAG: AAA family ATPase [Pseudomonadota bacterium]|uniref:AAA family ATPase n=1 Tax=Sphingobium sp. TaxID=1912891 RepID=UPI002E1C86B6